MCSAYLACCNSSWGRSTQALCNIENLGYKGKIHAAPMARRKHTQHYVFSKIVENLLDHLLLQKLSLVRFKLRHLLHIGR